MQKTTDCVLEIIEWVAKNKEWIFSGIGVILLAPVLWLFRRLFHRSAPKVDDRRQTGQKVVMFGSLPQKVETRDSVPLGLQSFSFLYGPGGHGCALTLKRALVRAEIEFTCEIVNPYKALFSADQYALNVLRPRFVLRARGILEAFSLSRLRADREKIAHDIVAQLSPEFEDLGVRLVSVTIGALDQLKGA